MGKLNQVLAVEKGIKAKAENFLTEAYKTAQKPALFNGFAKDFKPVNEAGETFPPENNRVQVRAADLLGDLRRELVGLLDVSLAKDVANCSAKADIVVDGTVFAKDVPATNLLFLEKKLTDLKTFVSTLPVLDSAESWSIDAQAGLFKSERVKSARSAKVQEPLVLYPATDKHPAQTQIITRDVTIGHWDTVKLSGALPADTKALYVERCEALLRAVQQARVAANAAEAPDANIGKPLLDFIFRG